VLRSTGQYQNTIVGVVSTAPGFVAGSKTIDSVPIALVGRVPVRFSTENGPLKSGDYLTSASIPGYAMRATQAGRVIGTALEDMDKNKLSDCPAIGSGQFIGTKCGTLTVFVNLASYSGASVEMLMQEDLDNSASLLPEGITAESDAGKTEQSKILDFLVKVRDSKSGAQSLSEIFTDRVAASIEIITPKLFAGGLSVDTISSSKEAIDLVSDVIFFGRPYFNTDTAGFAKISKGDKFVDVVFSKDYLEQPIVNVTITMDVDPNLKDATDENKIKEIQDAQSKSIDDFFAASVQFLVVNKSDKGFRIILKEEASDDFSFSWIALAVKGAKTFFSLKYDQSDIIAPTFDEPADESENVITTEPVTNNSSDSSEDDASEDVPPENTISSEVSNEDPDISTEEPVVDNGDNTEEFPTENGTDTEDIQDVETPASDTSPPETLNF
jgi:hypothetical protein